LAPFDSPEPPSPPTRLALSVYQRQYKLNFLVLHYRPDETLGDRAATGDCQPGDDPLQIVHGDQ